MSEAIDQLVQLLLIDEGLKPGGFLDKDQFVRDLIKDMYNVADGYRGGSVRLTAQQIDMLMAAAITLAGALVDDARPPAADTP